MFSCYRTNRWSITLLQHYTCEKWITCIVVQYSLIPIHSPLHHCSTTAPLAFLSFTLPSLPPYRSLVSLLPQSWQTGWRIVITSSCYQLKHLLYLPTSVSSNSMGGGGWGLLCRMRTSSQWYEGNMHLSFAVVWKCYQHPIVSSILTAVDLNHSKFLKCYVSSHEHCVKSL